MMLNKIHGLAIDIIAGRVYTSQQAISDGNSVSHVFPTLALLSDEEHDKFQQRTCDGEISILYQYVKRGRSLNSPCNGVPCFITFKTLTEIESMELSATILDTIAIKKGMQ